MFPKAKWPRRELCVSFYSTIPMFFLYGIGHLCCKCLKQDSKELHCLSSCNIICHRVGTSSKTGVVFYDALVMKCLWLLATRSGFRQADNIKVINVSGICTRYGNVTSSEAVFYCMKTLEFVSRLLFIQMILETSKQRFATN